MPIHRIANIIITLFKNKLLQILRATPDEVIKGYSKGERTKDKITMDLLERGVLYARKTIEDSPWVEAKEFREG